jgi:hypothetical protein
LDFVIRILFEKNMQEKQLLSFIKNKDLYEHVETVLNIAKGATGDTESKIYKTWVGIKTRCYNKNRSDYKFYGERGISLSDEFHDVPLF